MSNWERLVWNQRDALLSGLGVTLEICFLAFAGAIVGGLILCLVRLYVAPLRPVAVLLIEFFRATPIFVQLMWVNYVWPEDSRLAEHLLHGGLGRACPPIERIPRRDFPDRN